MKFEKTRKLPRKIKKEYKKMILRASYAKMVYETTGQKISDSQIYGFNHKLSRRLSNHLSRDISEKQKIKIDNQKLHDIIRSDNRMNNFLNEVREGNNFMTALANCFGGSFLSKDELSELRKGQDEYFKRNKLINL